MPNTLKNLKKNHRISHEIYHDVAYENSIVSITNQEGTILEANDRFCEISGFTKEELEGSNHRIVNSGFHPKEFFQEMYATLKKGQIWLGEICNRTKEGNLYWVDTRIYPLWNDDINEYEFVSVRLEVTHRKRFEEVLKNVQDVARIGYWEWSLENNSLFWSSMIYEIHGLTPEEYTPEVETSIENFAPGFRDVLAQKLEQAFETGEGYDLELQVLHKSGQPVWTRAVAEVEMVNGRAFRVYGTFQDIDKKKRTQIELTRSQQQLNLALESAGIGNWIYYPKKDKLVWDDSSFEIFGVDKEKFRGVFQDWQDCLHPDDIEKSSETFLKCIETKSRVYDNHFRVIHPTKGVRFIKGRANIDYDYHGDPVEVIGLNWDITKDVKYQEELVGARKKAIEATQAKSAFLATMSHEIRTPMNGMMGTLELLADTNLSKEQKEHLETVQMCGEQLLTIVNDILDFSKIEAGKMELEYRPFDLRKLLKGVVSMFEVQFTKKGLELKLEVASEVPKIIKGDETRLKQILTNLVSNAYKFTEEGFVRVDVQYDKRRSRDSMATLMFKVVDSGMGIPLEKQGRLFQSFRQVDDSTTRKFGGTGLGLAICSALVSSMGGHIGVESDEGVGSIFYFEMMAGIGHEQEIESNMNEQCSGHFRKDLKVMIAEDNPINQKLAVSFLNRIGIPEEQVSVCADGEVAWKTSLEAFYHEEPFDLILMDMHMPVMDGVSATENIIRDLHVQAPVIFAMTANVFEDDKKRCFEAGMKSFISKPIKKTVLQEKLCEFFPLTNEPQTNLESETKGNPMESSTELYHYIDTKKILFEFEEDFDIFEELVIDYLSQVDTFVASIKNGLDIKNSEEIKVAGHTLKGIVSNFYCEKLRQAAYELEMCGKEGSLENVEEKLGVFLSVNELALKEVKAFISRQKGKNQAA